MKNKKDEEILLKPYLVTYRSSQGMLYTSKVMAASVEHARHEIYISCGMVEITSITEGSDADG